MRNGLLILLVAMICTAQEKRPAPEPGLKSVAIRCANMDKMLAFYTEAFGGRFQPVDVGGGLKCQFGRVFGVLVKLVPLREKADFTSFPTHQLGFAVPDIDAVIASAEKHGGKREGKSAVRDPDGNTIELYQGKKPAPAGRLFVGVYAPGPKWLKGKPVGEQPLMEHGQYMLELFQAGKLRDGGPFLDSKGGIAVFIVKDEAEAKGIVANDPAIKTGVFTAVLHPWHAVNWSRFGR